jgi:TonB family protein
VIRGVAVTSLVLALAAGVARADDPKDPHSAEAHANALAWESAPTTSIAVVAELGQATAEQAPLRRAAASRLAAVGACFDKRGLHVAVLALVTVDKKGKTTRVTAAGSGDAVLERCLEKAVKPTKWPTSTAGGAIVLRIEGHGPGQDLGSQLAEVRDSTPAARLGSSGTVGVGTPTGTGASYGETVIKVLHRRKAAFNACYQKALEQDAKLAGALELTFTIGTDGKVTTASASKSIATEVDSCAVHVVKRIAFPAPPGGSPVTIKAPFTLTP